jgi:hypothetical protein
MSIILDSMRVLFNLKQKEGESLQDYTKCFKTAHNVIKSHIGIPTLLAKTISSMDGYIEGNKDKVEQQMNEAYNQLLAFTYLENSDKTKYGSLIRLTDTTFLEKQTIPSNHHRGNQNIKLLSFRYSGKEWQQKLI